MRWEGTKELEFPPLNLWQKLRAWRRLATLLIATAILLPFYWLARLIERIFPAQDLAHHIVWAWCAFSARLCGLRVETVGRPMPHGGAIVANHLGWPDIFVVLAAARLFFVSKSEVRSWPLMGALAAQTGTVFIERDPRKAKEQEAVFIDRLEQGHRLCFFPEGTSTDGRRVLPFKSTLFSAFMSKEMRDQMWVQPVSLIYAPQDDLPQQFFGWWGEMGFLDHLMQVFGRSIKSRVRVLFHDPVRPVDFSDRKALAKYCGDQVKRGHALQSETLQMDVLER